MNRFFCFLVSLFVIGAPDFAQAGTDPTGGKPFFSWLWKDQLKPTIQKAGDKGNLGLLAAGSFATIAAVQYDGDVYEHNRKGKDLIMSNETAGVFSVLGGGALGLGVAAAQIYFDQKNGLMHSRAIALTATSHVALAFLFQKRRPGGRGDYLPFDSAFPSGHASSIFATATSLAYAYGWWVGIPAYSLAFAISAARVSENAHWLSDVVAGAALGMFWARASHLATSSESNIAWFPVPYEDGGMLRLAITY